MRLISYSFSHQYIHLENKQLSSSYYQNVATTWPQSSTVVQKKSRYSLRKVHIVSLHLPNCVQTFLCEQLVHSLFMLTGAQCDSTCSHGNSNLIAWQLWLTWPLEFFCLWITCFTPGTLYKSGKRSLTEETFVITSGSQTHSLTDDYSPWLLSASILWPNECLTGANNWAAPWHAG